jgi:hypothetical protein
MIKRVVKMYLVILVLLFTFVGFAGAEIRVVRGEEGAPKPTKRVIWQKFKVPKEKIVTYSGSIELGFQQVEDTKGEKKSVLSSNSTINFKSRLGKGDMNGNISFNRERFTTGNQQGIGASLNFRIPELLELTLSSNLSDLTSIVSAISHKSKADSINIGLKFFQFKDFPLGINYSNSSNKTMQEGTTTQHTESENVSISFGAKIYKLQTYFSANLGKTSNPLQDSITETRSLGLNANFPITERFILNLSVSRPETDSDGVHSTGLNSSIGFNAQVFKNLRFMTNFGLNKREYKSQGTKTETEVLSQNYGASYQPFGWLALNTYYNFSDTKDANSSEDINVSISLSPPKVKLLRQVEFSYQTTRIEDAKGALQSESNCSTINSSFTLIKGMVVSGGFSTSIQKSYPLVGNVQQTTTNNTNLTLSHSVFESLSYGLTYGLNDSERNSSRNTTTSYSGNVNCGLKIGKRNIPISLNQTFTYSESGSQKVDTRATNVGIQIPITQVISTSYSYSISQAESDSTTNKTIHQAVGLSLKGKKKPFIINTKFSLSDSEGSQTRSINASLSYPILERLSFKLGFTQKSNTTTTSNLNIGLSYAF